MISSNDLATKHGTQGLTNTFSTQKCLETRWFRKQMSNENITLRNQNCPWSRGEIHNIGPEYGSSELLWASNYHVLPFLSVLNGNGYYD